MTAQLKASEYTALLKITQQIDLCYWTVIPAAAGLRDYNTWAHTQSQGQRYGNEVT